MLYREQNDNTLTLTANTPQWFACCHPFFFAAFAVTSLYAANVGKTPLRHVLLPLVVTLGLAAFIVWATRLAINNRTRAALAASYVVVISFSYSHCYFRAQRFVTFEIPRRYSLLAYATLLIGGIIVIRHGRFDAKRVSRTLHHFAMLLLIVSLLMIGASMARQRLGASSPTGAGRDEDAIVLQRPETPRDIYYLVFDRYASNQTLQEHFGFDNTPFLESLTDRGFHCATNSRTNYPKTVIAMSAALNLRYHDETILSEYYYSDLLRDHRVGRLLKEVGYQYYHFGNWYYPLRSNENADFNFRISRLPSEFADVLYKLTPLGHTDTADLTRTWGDPRIPKMKFDAVTRLAQTKTEAKFVYAHFLMPHPPFVLDKDGTLLPRQVLSSRGKNQNYVNQLIFTNQRILRMVDAIQQASQTPPIIIIQADEGPELYDVDKDKDWIARTRKRSGIISAFCLPDVDSEKKIAPTITPVNTFRLVFSEYFGADIDLLPDRCFFWKAHSPFHPPRQRCIEVTAEVFGDTSRMADMSDASEPGGSKR